jgi:hypothetical protein
MGMTSSDPPGEIIKRYKIQDCGRSRGITIPNLADFEKGDLVWVWSKTDTERVKSLSVTKQPPEASSDGQEVDICEHYTIQRNGGRKFMTIPDECGEKFADGAHVVVVGEKPVHLRVIPQQACVQALVGITR